MPSRRAYLTGAGALFAATAGCVSADDPAGESNASTPTPNEPSDVTLSDVGVRKAVTYESMMGSGGVLAAAGEQYVVASVAASETVSASEFAFEADGESWEPGLPATAGGTNRSVAGREGRPLGQAHAPDHSYLAFAVPSPLSATGAAIRYEGSETGTWPLDDAATSRLEASEPRFELTSLDVPSEVPQGASLDLSMGVQNISETDGQFLAAIYWPTHGIADDDESHIVARAVAGGESEAVSLSIDTRYTALENGPVSLYIQGHVTAEQEVYVSGASTPE